MSRYRRWTRYIVGLAGALAGVTALGLLAAATSSRAAEVVSIVSQMIQCDRASVTYTVVGTFAEETALLSAFRADGTDIGHALGPASPDGTYTAAVEYYEPEPSGSQIYVVVEASPTSAQTETVACSGGQETSPPDPGWSGYSDGRLNPVPDEYYSVWCSFDQVEVWRGVPDSELIRAIPLWRLVDLSSGASFDAGGGLTVSRNGDIVTISGSNGNGPTHPGSKSLSLSECVARNGGLPERPPTSGSPGGGAPATPVSPESVEAFCLSLRSAEDIITCLQVLSDRLSSVQILFLWIFQLCLPGALLIFAPGAFYAWRRRRRSHQRGVVERV